MKKFAKMLALGLALAMTFGMTAFADNSPITPDPDDGATVWYPQDFVYADVSVTEEVAESMAKDIEASAKSAGQDIIDIVDSFSLTPPANWDGKPVTIQFSDTPALGASEGFVLYHFKDGKFVGEIAVVWNNVDKRYQATIPSFSDFVLVKVKDNGTVKPGLPPVEGTAPATTTATGAPVSPKTGETLPVAGMMAVLCLAGVVVCAKKARCNG